MGAGDFQAGAGPAGFDPVYVPATPSPPFLPRAPFFDPSINQFLTLDENGNPIDMHPIDQIVTLRLTTRKGQSKSATSLGTRLAIVCARLPAPKVLQTAYNEVRSVMQDLITNGDVLLLSVTVKQLRGQNVFAVAYVNLRDPATNPRFPTSNKRSISVVGVNT
jgi:hypothetical protein